MTLTLPGFAGLILTIGVAADANVVVFERIKEEVRAGKSVRAAISAGYGKGFHTILDANVVTAITALVLFLIAVASVKGFALMLLIGTLISLLTAVAATRALLGLLSGFRWFDNPRFMGAQGAADREVAADRLHGQAPQLWFAISGAIIVAGVVSLGVQGLNLGIDFKGGTQITFKTHTGATRRSERPTIATAATAVRTRSCRAAAAPSNGDRTSSGRSGRRRSTQAEQDAVPAGPAGPGRRQRSADEDVSASFGRQIAKDAILGIIVSLLLIIDLHHAALRPGSSRSR